LSLKYSAIVNHVKATLALGPGVSFICQYTIAVLFNTQDSFISLYKSFPSLVLSQTQATTETQLCSTQILWINSIIITVFQTQAHPNKPTFHHFKIGAKRSTTLIHVSNISDLIAKSVNSGVDL
jgi:hypothetical protein